MPYTKYIFGTVALIIFVIMLPASLTAEIDISYGTINAAIQQYKYVLAFIYRDSAVLKEVLVGLLTKLKHLISRDFIIALGDCSKSPGCDLNGRTCAIILFKGEQNFEYDGPLDASAIEKFVLDVIENDEGAAADSNGPNKGLCILAFVFIITFWFSVL